MEHVRGRGATGKVGLLSRGKWRHESRKRALSHSVVIINARVFDGHDAELHHDVDVAVEDGRIVGFGKGARIAAAQTIDLQGRILLPGLIDAHVHAYAVELDLTRASRRPWTYIAHHAARLMRHMLTTGFTTVRDVGGGDIGLAQAITDGLLPGPRLFYGGRVLSQTGGHADWRHGGEFDPACSPCGCGMIDQRCAVIADGVDDVIKAAREELRRGASHVKIMTSGGVASPSDAIVSAQYSDEEIAAVVAETARHGCYVAAHCHPAEGIIRSARLGVRSIEHATLATVEAASAIKDAGAFAVPTLAVMNALLDKGAGLGLPAASLGKLHEIVQPSQASLEIMRDAGVAIGFGTDLLGPLYDCNLTEFSLRRDVFSPLEILRQATSINARLLRAKGRLGCVAVGAFADLVAIDGDPFADIGIMAAGPARMPFVMQNGNILRNALD